MKNALRYLLASFFLLLCSFLNAEHPESAIKFLNRSEQTWKLGRELRSGEQTTTIYIPENETIENWTEIFGVHTISEGGEKPKNLQEEFSDLIGKFFPKDTPHIRILRNSESDFFVEWWIDKNSSNQQHGWMRLINTDKGIVILQYATKKTDQLEEARRVWEPLIGETKANELIEIFTFSNI